MKTRLYTPVAFLAMTAVITLIGSPAAAQDLAWGGTQLQTVVSGELELAEHVGLRGQLAGFFVPHNGTTIAFAYAGPTFTPLDSDDLTLWVSPQLVGALGWFEKADGLGPSLWVRLDLFQKALVIFLEGDVLIGAGIDEQSYYGYYALDWNPLDWLNAGGQVEQVNLDLIAGPHVGITKGPLHLELQYYLGEGFHTIRVLTMLNF
ncbi:hypothetical protein AMJ57_03990 [Parcubacteria bacterium SG8_24]|nr:MAG: hypothetical protein AMJ57_03990 [Parcubacteria bacterium SG8_24]